MLIMMRAHQSVCLQNPPDQTEACRPCSAGMSRNVQSGICEFCAPGLFSPGDGSGEDEPTSEKC